MENLVSKPTTSEPPKLSKQYGPRQRRTRFVKEFLLDQNSTRAALAAGYSKKAAHVTGCRLLKDVNVRAAIEEQSAKVNAKLEVTLERVRSELAKLAFFNPQDFFMADGSLRPINELPPETAAAIAGIEVSELFDGSGEARAKCGLLKKLRLADRGLNLERLGRYLKMFTDKVEMSEPRTTDANLEQRIAELERDLGLARQIDEAGRAGVPQARTRKANGASEDQ